MKAVCNGTLLEGFPPQTGLEPKTTRSVGQRLTHQATGACTRGGTRGETEDFSSKVDPYEKGADTSETNYLFFWIGCPLKGTYSEYGIITVMLGIFFLPSAQC